MTNGKDKYKNRIKSGVYKLQCQNCNGCYNGQTGRSFKPIIKEHVKVSQHNAVKPNSFFALNLIRENHSFDPNQFKILYI